MTSLSLLLVRIAARLYPKIRFRSEAYNYKVGNRYVYFEMRQFPNRDR